MIIKADILQWAEEYDGEPMMAVLCDPLLATFDPLYFCICATMTLATQCCKIFNHVRFFVALNSKPPKRLDVMNNLARAITMLTGVIVAFQCLAPLSLPVRAAIVACSQVLRMVQAVPMFISTFARAVFTAALALFQPTHIHLKSSSAIKTHEGLGFGFRRARSDGSVLALTRAVLAATVF